MSVETQTKDDQVTHVLPKNSSTKDNITNCIHFEKSFLIKIKVFGKIRNIRVCSECLSMLQTFDNCTILKQKEIGAT